MPLTGQVSEGRVLRGLGFAMLVLGFGAAFALRFASLGEDLQWLYFAPAIAILGGAAILYRGKQRAARARSRLLATEGTGAAPVLYLRPFADDEPGWRAILGAVLTIKLFTPVLSLEEQLADAVAPIGPLLGIGQPGESLPKPGAVRAYPERWREDVEDLLRRARLVIVRPGDSAGLLWEIQRVFRMVAPEKVLLLVSAGDRKAFPRTRSAIAEACGADVPAFTAVKRGAFIEFGPNWTPHILPLRVPFWRSQPTAPLKCRFNHTLAPVFRRLDLPWRASPVSALLVTILAIPAVFLLGAAGLVVSAFVTNSDDGSPTYREQPLTTGAAGPGDGATTDTAPAPGAAPAEVQTRDVAGIRLAISGEPRAQEITLTPEVRARLDALESYEIPEGPLRVGITRSVAKAGLTPSLPGAAQGGLDGMRRSGVTLLESRLDSASVSGLPAIRTTASALIEGQKWSLLAVTFVEGQSVWAVQVMVPPGQDTAAANRILDSVALAPAESSPAAR